MPSSSTEPTLAKRGTPWLNLALSLLTLVLLFLLLEGLGSVLMAGRAAKHALKMQEESHSQYDADLGWRNRPSLKIDNLYGPGAVFTTNTQGFRSPQGQDYAVQVPAGRYRVVALGDSFTMGYGVGDSASYPAQMQVACALLQTVNMGQGGYGLDQAYLWYRRDGAALDAQVLLVAPIAHDFYRMKHDRFVGYAKPVLAVEGGKLVVRNVPVPADWSWRTPARRAMAFVNDLALVRLARVLLRGPAAAQAPAQDTFYGDIGDEVFAAAGLALDDLAASGKTRGRTLVLAYLPVEDMLDREPSREAQWMQAYARRTGVPFIDLVPEFKRLAPAERAAMYRPDKHFSEAGNRLVAQALLAGLAQQVPGFPACGTAKP
jgi:lysophospholipase L1-like esterase